MAAHNRSNRVEHIAARQIIRRRDFRLPRRLRMALRFHHLLAVQPKLHTRKRMDAVVNAPVIRHVTASHPAVRRIHNRIAPERGDIALPEIQSGLLPLKILICPVETTLMLISDRWKVLIIRDLLTGTKRFSELFHRLISGHSVSFPDTVSSFPICVPLKKTASRTV